MLSLIRFIEGRRKFTKNSTSLNSMETHTLHSRMLQSLPASPQLFENNKIMVYEHFQTTKLSWFTNTSKQQIFKSVTLLLGGLGGRLQ